MGRTTNGELLDAAGALNGQLEDRGFEKLDEVTVLKHAENMWKDAQEGKLEHWVGREVVARIRGSAINHLCRLDRKSVPTL